MCYVLLILTSIHIEYLMIYLLVIYFITITIVLGFLVWDVSQGKHTSQTSIPWKDHYLALLEYAHIHGHCNVPRKDWFDCTLPASATSPIRRYHGNLGEWLHTQKAKLTTSTTSSSADRIVLLRQLVDEGNDRNSYKYLYMHKFHINVSI